LSGRLRHFGLALAFCVIAAEPAFAQKAMPKPTAVVEPATPAAEPPPPYEAQLLRLTEIMGALAYLRGLCGAHDADVYRGKVASLLEVEGRGEARKEMLAGAFNRGFRGYELFYRVCTPAAREAIARFLDETVKISADLANRYGG
jgi:uncharacterized protein (TIGR02301 family)